MGFAGKTLVLVVRSEWCRERDVACSPIIGFNLIDRVKVMCLDLQSCSMKLRCGHAITIHAGEQVGAQIHTCCITVM